jgi:hypothetical protein
MAHIGKNYRLHFRRDLGTGISNNNRSLAWSYTVGAADIGGTVGGPLTSMNVLVEPVDERTFNGAKWQSAYQTISGRQIRYVIECSTANGFPTNVCRVRVEDSLLGNLVEANAVRIQNQDYGFIEAKQLYSGPTHPALLSTNGPNILFQMRFVPW